MSADRPNPPALRASDADRDRAIELLHAALADGRLDPVEFDERLDAALAARTIDALTPLVADLHASAGGVGALVVAGPTEPAAELVTIKEKHGVVRRSGRWTLPQRLAVRTAWCDVQLDLTSAVRTGPRLVIELRVNGGNVELILVPGMTVDTNDLSVRHSLVEVSTSGGTNAPETLHVSVIGRMRHGRLATRWQAPTA